MCSPALRPAQRCFDHEPGYEAHPGETRIRKAAGIRLGRCSDITPNDPDFGEDEVAVMQRWCQRSGIPYLGRADIGHDIDNRVVPFGTLKR